jgi:astacin
MSGEYSGTGQKKKGWIRYVSERTGKIKLKELTCSVVRGKLVFEGDIVVGTKKGVADAEKEGRKRIAANDVKTRMSRKLRAGHVMRGCIIVGAQYRWPNLTVPYRIQSGFPWDERITDAIAHWEENTPIQFVERTTETDFVEFIEDPDGCWSWVGRQGNRQQIGLAAGCGVGTTIHEIGHAVGLWHEQSREDRDEHVTIHWDRIQAGREHNFDQHIADGDDVLDYDYDSIMHYGRTAFSTGGDTITPPPGVTIGQRDGLSLGDIAAVTYMYGYGGYYVGNKRTGEFHHPSCSWAGMMSYRNRKYFWTVEALDKSGYNGCYHCQRLWDTG